MIQQAGIEILELQREINERLRSSENLLPATVFFGAFVVVRKLVPLHYVAYEFVDFCLLPNSNLQLALFVPSLLGPLCNSWLCILCIFFRNFLQLQDIHSWLNSDFHFSNMFFFQQMAGTFLHDFFG